MELFSNNATTTLNGSILSGATSLVVTSASLFPVSGNFHLIIDSEIFLATSVSSNTFTVSPGQEGTSQAGHSNGATVAQVVTNQALQNFRADSDSFGTYAGTPSPTVQGRVFWPTDGPYLQLDTGSAMLPYGPVFPVTVPNLTGYGYTNQGSSTVTTTTGNAVMTAPAQASDNLRIFAKNIPSTPFTYTLGVIQTGPGLNNLRAGLVITDGTKCVDLAIFGNSPFLLINGKWTTVSAYSANYAMLSGTSCVIPGGSLIYLRLNDDGSTRTWSFSMDGKNFVTVSTNGHTDFLTATKIGFFVNPNSGTTFTQTLNVLSIS